MKILIAGLIYWLGSILQLSAQSVMIYADTARGDTLKKIISILSSELKKSPGIGTVSIASAKNYKGTGIFISTASGSPADAVRLKKKSIESFSVVANGQTVKILGNCQMAIGHGVFTWLESLGYRYYFANSDWYITPAGVKLYSPLNLVSSPSFDHRKIWYGYGTGSDKADKDYFFWVLANKLGGAMNASFGHSYGNIIARNKSSFQQHPEWFYPPAQNGTVPADGKFDMSREGLVQLVIKDAEDQIQASLRNNTPAYKMISVAPSDDIGTCNSPACQQLGSITDRVFYLVNRVAAALRQKYPSTLFGCMAYSEYSEPPTRRLEPNVFVAVTTAFNNSAYSTPQLIEKWRAKGAIVGLYDYFSWYMWDHDLPGQSLVSRTTEMAENIKKYHRLGLKAYDAESSIGWISKGLGYYIAAKLMWDVSADVNKIKQEFFDRCFKKASEPMKQLWNDWENYSAAMVRESSLAEWMDLVAKAEILETDQAVLKRLLQVKSYLHYLFLYRVYEDQKNEQNLLALLNYGYRKLDEGSVSGYPAFFVLGARSGINGMGFTPDAKWRKNNTPVSDQEMNSLIRNDRNQLQTRPSVKLVAAASRFKTVPAVSSYPRSMMDSANVNNAFWMFQEFVIEVKKKSAGNYIELTGDYIGNPDNKKPITLKIYQYRQDGNFSGQPVLLSYDYRSALVKEKISLATLAPGYYSVVVTDPTKIFKIDFSTPLNYSAVARPGNPIRSKTLGYAFIYVPAGVSHFNLLKNHILELMTPTGRQLSFKAGKEEDIQIQVQKGEAGLWRIRSLYENLQMEGIPPYLGISPERMLIPAEAN
ncbi:MAG: hypothetical protein DI535_10615 [Citrobacter freundii]|nr:MAG: hypothetical protein DI535_10615 [Citrobacter freundii]